MESISSSTSDTNQVKVRSASACLEAADQTEALAESVKSLELHDNAVAGHAKIVDFCFDRFRQMLTQEDAGGQESTTMPFCIRQAMQPHVQQLRKSILSDLHTDGGHETPQGKCSQCTDALDVINACLEAVQECNCHTKESSCLVERTGPSKHSHTVKQCLRNHIYKRIRDDFSIHKQPTDPSNHQSNQVYPNHQHTLISPTAGYPFNYQQPLNNTIGHPVLTHNNQTAGPFAFNAPMNAPMGMIGASGSQTSIVHVGQLATCTSMPMVLSPEENHPPQFLFSNSNGQYSLQNGQYTIATGVNGSYAYSTSIPPAVHESEQSRTGSSPLFDIEDLFDCPVFQDSGTTMEATRQELMSQIQNLPCDESNLGELSKKLDELKDKYDAQTYLAVLNQPCRCQHTPLIVAVLCEQRHAFKLLLDYGATLKVDLAPQQCHTGNSMGNGAPHQQSNRIICPFPTVFHAAAHLANPGSFVRWMMSLVRQTEYRCERELLDRVQNTGGVNAMQLLYHRFTSFNDPGAQDAYHAMETFIHNP